MISCELTVRVTPRSSRNRIEFSDGQIRAWVTAPPTDGQANEAVRIAIANALDLPKSNVVIVRGHTSREKTLEVEGVDLTEACRRLEGEAAPREGKLKR